MKNELTKPESKKVYESPQLTTISLRPEEAVLGHCKISGGSGPSGQFGPCDIMTLGCHSIGS